MVSHERRRWRRLGTELRLKLQVLADEGAREIHAIGSHLNPTGIFVQVADPPPMGARVRVTLDAEGTDGVLTAEGKVVARVLVDDASGSPPGCGLELEETGPAWNKLYNWLTEQLTESNNR